MIHQRGLHSNSALSVDEKRKRKSQEEASTSDVKPAADESQIVSNPKERKGDAEIASVPEELTSPEPAAKAKGWLISECSFAILNFLINQQKI